MTNGHSYDAVFVEGNPSWFVARDAAAAMSFGGFPGHLATFVTGPEQEFVITALGGGGLLNALWLGGYQDTASPSYHETDGGWNWITGEPWLEATDFLHPRWSFNNTYFDGIRSEEHTITWWDNGGINDYWHTPDSSPVPARGFIVEFEASTVPEPGNIGLGLVLAFGVSTLVARRRRATRSQDGPKTNHPA